MFRNPESIINIDNLRLKRIYGIHIEGTPKLGLNMLEVNWAVWSDCGPAYIEFIQYIISRREIHIWIWGRSTACPQVVAWDTHHIEIFILIPGSWIIICNRKSIIISV